MSYKPLRINMFRICLLSLTTLFFSCQQEREIEHSQDHSSDDFSMKILNQSPELSARIHPINQKVEMTKVVKDFPFNRSITEPNIEENYWQQIASLAPLKHHDGRKLSVSFIDIDYDIAYITYNLHGADHGGALESIDLSDPENPKVINRVVFYDSDANVVRINRDCDYADKRRVWVALSNFRKGAVVVEFESNKGHFSYDGKYVALSNAIPTGAITSNANGLDVSSTHLYVSTAKKYGGTFKIDKSDLSVVNQEFYPNAKFVTFRGYTGCGPVITLLGGDQAKYRLADSNLNYSVEHAIGSLNHENVEFAYDGKATIAFSPHMRDGVYFSMAKGGAVLTDFTNGEILYQTHSDMLTNGNTNGLSVDQNFIYLANGADGIAIAPHPYYTDSDTIDPLFYWDAGTGSANYIASRFNWVFVAKGTGGFIILKREDPYGAFASRDM